jgi:hypothetical protein
LADIVDVVNHGVAPEPPDVQPSLSWRRTPIWRLRNFDCDEAGALRRPPVDSNRSFTIGRHSG